jgi:hypothetical protein
MGQLAFQAGYPRLTFSFCDLHLSHRAASVKSLAEDLNIEIHYIFAGAVEVLRPLDRRIFGVLKSQARRRFHRHVNEDHLHRRTKSEACKDLMTAWARLSHEIISTSWDIYEKE